MIRIRLPSSRLFGKGLVKQKGRNSMINFKRISRNGKGKLKPGKRSLELRIRILRKRRKTRKKMMMRNHLIPKINLDQDKRDLQAVIEVQKRIRRKKNRKRIRTRRRTKRRRNRSRKIERNPKAKITRRLTKKKRNPTKRRTKPRSDLHSPTFDE